MSAEEFIHEKRKTATELVVDFIKEKIKNGRLQVGDKLQTEAELCLMLGVGRSAVREAIKILQTIGVVNIVRGDGMYITNGDVNVSVEPLLYSFLLSNPDKQQIFELRMMIELGVVRSIIDNASEADLEDIHQQILTMQAMLKNQQVSVKRMTQADLDFHSALGRATHNPLVEKIYALVISLMEKTVETTHDRKENFLTVIDIHNDIYVALIQRDHGLAEKAILRSLDSWRELF